MTSEFTLRPATPDDLPELSRIENAVHVAPWSEASFAGELEKPYSQTLLMTDDETDSVIAGYIVFWMMPPSIADECQILNVAVEPTFQRRGYALQMIRKAISLAVQQRLKRGLLHVRKSNSAAIQLYQKAGFTTHCIRKRFYSNGEDAYEMTLDLAAPHVLEF